ncbi:hypothetical protein G6F35_016509 [Rhizopus arrhizus]|nr:hypothetical protein G6F35_016509 [Rhizopus arrhizus]
MIATAYWMAGSARVQAAQLGARQLAHHRLDRVGIAAAQPLVQHVVVALRGRQGDVLVQPVGLQLLVHLRHIAAIHLLQATFQGRQVALLVADLTLGVRLGALDRQAVQADGGADRRGVVELADEQVTLAGRLAGVQVLDQLRVPAQRLLQPASGQRRRCA